MEDSDKIIHAIERLGDRTEAAIQRLGDRTESIYEQLGEHLNKIEESVLSQNKELLDAATGVVKGTVNGVQKEVSSLRASHDSLFNKVNVTIGLLVTILTSVLAALIKFFTK